MDHKNDKLQQNLRVTQLIYIALALSLSIFLIVCLVVGKVVSQPPLNSSDSLNLPLILLMFLFFFFPTCLFISKIVFSRTIKRSKTRSSETLKTAMVLRIFFLEAPALFGLVGCLLAGMRDTLLTEPILWLLLVPYLYFLFMIKNTFPTRQLFEEFMAEIGSPST